MQKVAGLAEAYGESQEFMEYSPPGQNNWRLSMDAAEKNAVLKFLNNYWTAKIEERSSGTIGKVVASAYATTILDMMCLLNPDQEIEEFSELSDRLRELGSPMFLDGVDDILCQLHRLTDSET